MSAERDYLAWRRQPAVGCFFARHLATRYADYPQRIVSIPTGRGAHRATTEIAERISAFVGDPDIVAATLLFPGLTTLEETARMMLALKDHPGWSVSTAFLQPPPNREMVTVHVSREIPFGTTTCPSEVLVLGPYKEFPNTRRAPITALEMYVGEPLANDPKTGTPTVKANLAHMELNLPTPTAREKMWDKSIEGRKQSLGGDDNRAKAKVTFVIPVPTARRLGCLP